MLLKRQTDARSVNDKISTASDEQWETAQVININSLPLNIIDT